MSDPTAGTNAWWMKRAYAALSFLLVGLFLVQFVLAAMIVVLCASSVFSPDFDPDFIRQFSNHPGWSFLTWANLLLGAFVTVTSGVGMLSRKRWAPAAYSAWAVFAIGSNVVNPFPSALLLWPNLALPAFVGVFYLAFREFEDRVFAADQSPPLWTPLAILKGLAMVVLNWGLP